MFELSQIGTLRIKTLSLRIMRSFLTEKTIISLAKNQFYLEKIQKSRKFFRKLHLFKSKSTKNDEIKPKNDQFGAKTNQTSQKHVENSEINFKTAIFDFLSFIFYQIGALILNPGHESEILSDFYDNSDRKFVNIRSGAACQILAMEYAAMVRVMAKRECFQIEICESIVAGLDDLPDLVDFERMTAFLPKNSSEKGENVDKKGKNLTKTSKNVKENGKSENGGRLVKAMAALVVIGGFSNVFRVGGKAVSSEKEGGGWNEVGTVYEYDEAYGRFFG